MDRIQMAQDRVQWQPFMVISSNISDEHGISLAELTCKLIDIPVRHCRRKFIATTLNRKKACLYLTSFWNAIN